ncbi:MAG: hypothetical protein IJ094_02930 [Bacilli bacterium]|nr:hypothetical protein [Bacilli bacterium]
MAMVMWIASPSSVNKYLLTLTDTKGIGTSATHEKNNSFRPVVCLKSDAVLTKVSDTEYRIY